MNAFHYPDWPCRYPPWAVGHRGRSLSEGDCRKRAACAGTDEAQVSLPIAHCPIPHAEEQGIRCSAGPSRRWRVPPTHAAISVLHAAAEPPLRRRTVRVKRMCCRDCRDVRSSRHRRRRPRPWRSANRPSSRLLEQGGLLAGADVSGGRTIETSGRSGAPWKPRKRTANRRRVRLCAELKAECRSGATGNCRRAGAAVLSCRRVR